MKCKICHKESFGILCGTCRRNQEYAEEEMKRAEKQEIDKIMDYADPPSNYDYEKEFDEVDEIVYGDRETKKAFLEAEKKKRKEEEDDLPF